MVKKRELLRNDNPRFWIRAKVTAQLLDALHTFSFFSSYFIREFAHNTYSYTFTHSTDMWMFTREIRNGHRLYQRDLDVTYTEEIPRCRKRRKLCKIDSVLDDLTPLG